MAFATTPRHKGAPQHRRTWKKSRTSQEKLLERRMLEVLESPLLCCPEDVRRKHGCPDKKHLCVDCRMPICRSWMKLQDRQTVPEALANDNRYGYLQHWIYKVGVTWMEKTVSTPFWNGMTLFTMNRQKGRRRHLARAHVSIIESHSLQGASLQRSDGLE